MSARQRTPAGQIPNDWGTAYLKDIANVVRGASPRPAGSPLYFGGDFVPWITVADVTRDDQMYLTSTRSYLTELGSQFTRIIESGTLLLTNSGATLGVPKITTIKAGANDGIAMILNLQGVNQKFAYYFLQSKTQHLRNVVAPGNGQPNLNTDLIGEIAIPLPSCDEQRHIADALLVWDNSITKTEHLLTNVRKQKQALQQAVLTGRRRLSRFQSRAEMQQTPHGLIPADWKHPRIEVFAKEVVEKLGANAAYPVLSCTKHAGLVDSLSYFKKQVYSADTSTYKVVPRDCFVYATNHIEEGSIGYQNSHAFGLVSPMYTVFKTSSKILDGYLYRLLKTEHFRQIFAAATNASVDRRGSLRWKDFKKLRVPLPSLDEQAAISALLDSADREIELFAKRLDALRAEKTALMQQLLTGKRRFHADTTSVTVSA